ncbi:hypothetical protein [Sessilibacter corallicola]|uniref:Heavy-metal resistance protein CzcE n=1 Tax=Sessilibacter corallicola TaxID=2904075 RepID=A0ABQ0A5V5_9GAMM|nr:hypothetical protein [Sessilibacter corallicola]MCE2027677.1 hypothetical protein [Sessilibacter corallicola]
MKKSLLRLLAFTTTLFLFSTAHAGEAKVIDVKIKHRGSNVYDFRVTVEHADAGWKHYANRWEILDENGEIIATRVLHHPHDNEQPFTRGLRNVAIPAEVNIVEIRAHDSRHGYGSVTKKIEIPR